MTQEEKAKAYDEAIRKLRGMMPNWERLSYNGKTFLQDLIHIIPELKQSEGERIRKELVKVFSNKEKYLIDQSFGDITVSEVLAWLEKQGEKKPATIDIDKMVDDYANNKERGNEEFGKPVLCMIRAYRQGLNDAIEKVVLKSAWSEEDKKKLNRIYYLIAEAANEHAFSTTCRLIGDKECVELQDFLKSIKQRIGG